MSPDKIIVKKTNLEYNLQISGFCSLTNGVVYEI